MIRGNVSTQTIHRRGNTDPAVESKRWLEPIVFFIDLLPDLAVT